MTPLVVQRNISCLETSILVLKEELVLLLGGLVCFGVSFAYNKLDKMYGEIEEISSMN